MKKLIITSILAVLVALGTTVKAQDYPDEYLGLPGDNLNLYAVMKLFQESETLEGFERSLNDQNSRINNLDLNGDNLIDYITVTDYVDRNVHTIVLRVALDRNENQDVAVFTVEKFNNGSAQIQLIGDEALYGRNYIIEPIYDETPNPGYMGRRENVTDVTIIRTSPYEIAAWPLVRFIYLPNYVMWRSSWYWGYYPSYWSPWRPYYWHYYYGYHYNWYHDYYGHYRHWDHYRYTRYNDFYYSGIRAHSPVVRNRINEGSYKVTYSRPEQRRDGEALFTKIYPDREKRTPADVAVNRDGRRSVSQTSRERTNEVTNVGTSRRTNTTADEKAATRTEPAQSGGTLRRAPAGNSKSEATQSNSTERRSSTAVSRPEANRNTSTERRSSTTVSRPEANRNTNTERRSSTTVSRPEANQNTSTERRSSTTVSRPEANQRAGTSRRSTANVSKPEPNKRTETARTSRQETKSANSSNRRSNTERRSSTAKKSTKEKESEDTKSSRKR